MRIERKRYVVMRRNRTEVWCGLSKNFSFRPISEVKDVSVKTYHSEAQAESGCSSWDRDFEVVPVIETILTEDELPTLPQPSSEPLTLEELRGMDGEPAWITPAKARGNIPARWMLFAGVRQGVCLFMPAGGISQGYRTESYGKTWLAYRRPPEGEEEI